MRDVNTAKNRLTETADDMLAFFASCQIANRAPSGLSYYGIVRRGSHFAVAVDAQVSPADICVAFEPLTALEERLTQHLHTSALIDLWAPTKFEKTEISSFLQINARWIASLTDLGWERVPAKTRRQLTMTLLGAEP